MEDFDYKKFLIENKLTTNSRMLKENEEQIPEDIKANFSFDARDNSPKVKFGRTITELYEMMDEWGIRFGDVQTIDNLFSDEMSEVRKGDPEGFYAGYDESLKVFKSLPNIFTVTNDLQSGHEPTVTVEKLGDDSFKFVKNQAITNSQNVNEISGDAEFPSSAGKSYDKNWGFNVEFHNEPEYGDALVITHKSNIDVNLVITADAEESNGETVTASGEFVLGGKKLYWYIATG